MGLIFGSICELHCYENNISCRFTKILYFMSLHKIITKLVSLFGPPPIPERKISHLTGIVRNYNHILIVMRGGGIFVHSIFLLLIHRLYVMLCEYNSTCL